jgi:ribose 5-phosphate isomerase B
VANRFSNIRAALCRDQEDALLARQHNDANVLCLAARKTSPELAFQMAQVFLITSFEGGRHKIRIDQFNLLGN